MICDQIYFRVNRIKNNKRLDPKDKIEALRDIRKEKALKEHLEKCRTCAEEISVAICFVGQSSQKERIKCEKCGHNELHCSSAELGCELTCLSTQRD